MARRLDAAFGGAPAAAAHLASALAAEGHDVTIATTVGENRGEKEVEQLREAMGNDVPVLCFPRTGLPYDHSRRLASWLRRHAADYDMIEVHGIFDFPSWHAAAAARRAGCPYLIHPHGSLDPFDLQKHKRLKTLVGRFAVRRSLDGASSIMVTTRREGTALNRFGSSTPIYDCALPYRPSPHAPDPSRFRSKYHLSDDPIALFLGRVDYKKGLSHLVDAADLLARRGFALTAVIGGDTSSAYASELMKHVAERRLQPVVKFVGHLDERDKVDALAAASIFVLVSDNENYGLVLVEAARAGLPMIISSEVYLEQNLRSRGCAIVADRRGDSVADALEGVLSDRHRLDGMAQAAHVTAKTLFAWDVVSRAQSQYRNTLISAKRPSSDAV